MRSSDSKNNVTSWHSRRRWFVKPRKAAAACPFLESSTHTHILESAHAAHQSGRRHPGKPSKGHLPYPLSLCWFPWRACAWMEINKIERIDSPCRCARRPPNKCVFPFRKITKTNGLRISDGSERPPVTQRRPSKNERLSEMQMRHLCVCVRELIGSTRHNNTHALFVWWPGRARAQTLHLFARHLRAHQHLSAPSRIHKNWKIKIHFNAEQRLWRTLPRQRAADFWRTASCAWWYGSRPRRYNQESAPRAE